MRTNDDLEILHADTEFTDEHRDLYHRYQLKRHDARTSELEASDQLGFLRSRFINTYLVEARHAGELVCVCVVDPLPQGLSAVYTFYDPNLERRSLGIFGVLLLIEECRRLDLPWLYLGYWIKESSKMGYKEQFRPLHAYVNGHWTAIDEIEPAALV